MTATTDRRAGMNSRLHQGHHGEGFVFAMASSAGLLISRPSLDIDGIDWLIGFPGQLGTVRSPKIEVQVKSWSTLADRPILPATQNEAKTVVVAVPRSNLLTPDTLKALVAGDGEESRS